MAVRNWRLMGLGLAAVIAASLLAYHKFNQGLAVPQTAAPDERASTAAASAQAHSKTNEAGSFAAPAIHVSATAVLASVNGRELKLADLVPLRPDQKTRCVDFPPATYQYLLDRAVKRNLILQTAKAQGVSLDDSQRAQFAEFRNERNQREPGLVQQLNTDPGRLDFEVQDAEAFALQTALLARNGASPDITADDVQAYYSQHASDYPPLPTVEPARGQIWAIIDTQIRTSLAPVKRLEFQNQLTAYMNQLESSAIIALTPPNQTDSPAANSQAP